METGMLGLLGTGDWATDQRPMNWRQMLLRLYPNGAMPLTGLMSKLGSEATDDPQFHWWTKMLASQADTIVGTYIDVGMGTAYTTPATQGLAGQTVYVNIDASAATWINHFREGHVVLLRYTGDPTVDCVGRIIGMHPGGANTLLAVKLLENDDNSATHDISDADRILIIGNANAEGAEMPDAITYHPSKFYNYTQIFRTPLSITRTARKTRLRTPQQYKESKRECLELHGIEMEKALLFGIRTENIDEHNGKPIRTTMGLIPFINTYCPDNVSSFHLEEDYAGDSWLTSGYIWLMNILEQIFRYGSTEKLAVCGSGALLGLNFLAQNLGQVNITPTTGAYGMQVQKWLTPFGTIYLKTHPLFSYEVTNRYSVLITEPRLLKYRYIDDTSFYKDNNEKSRSDRRRVDGTDEEYLTEAGYEFHHCNAMGWLNGVGKDNEVEVTTSA